MLARCASVIAALFVVAIPRVAVNAQTPSRPIDAQNVRVEDAGGGAVRVTFDLPTTPAGSLFTVAIQASLDGGARFDVTPRTVEGDVGSGVRGGAGKSMVWHAAKDIERVAFDRMQFRVQATPAAPAAVVSQPAANTVTALPARGNKGLVKAANP